MKLQVYQKMYKCISLSANLMTKVTPKVRAPKNRAKILVRKACDLHGMGGLFLKLNAARDLSFV